MKSDPNGHFFDLLRVNGDRAEVLPHIHHMKDLLEVSPATILARFKEDQQRDFEKILESEELLLQGILRYPGAKPDTSSDPLSHLDHGQILRLFRELHDHVMSHPVWLHPFFVRFFQGEFNARQLHLFALNYFNQIKNTRQCVALALGRFHSLMPATHGIFSERIREIVQIILSQLVADEYGVGTHPVEQYPSLHRIFQSTTHIVMYRQLLNGLQIPSDKQDVPLFPGVADNVLIQRLLAGNSAFTGLESLASVGLGMEWGVPEFFTLLLGGILRFAWKNQFPLQAEHLIVLTAHVRYDVMHAISVMLATSLYVFDEKDVDSIKGAVNTLMAGRYAMMSDLYYRIFNEKIPDATGIDLDNRYRIKDQRMRELLIQARGEIAPGSVVEEAEYRNSKVTPLP